MDVHALAEVGGVFSLLVLLHFLADWGWQSNSEALKKSVCAWCRAGHCLKYAGAICTPLLFFIPGTVAFICLGILWLSHFAIDTYVPIYLWARFVRRPPNFRTDDPASFDYWEAFRDFATRPFGRILCLVIDQTLHILFLVPVATLMIAPQLSRLVCGISGVAILGLYTATWLGDPR